MTVSPAQGLSYGMPFSPTPYPPASMLSTSTPHQFYCWLHGWNNTHHGGTCKVRASNQDYTSAMKTASSPDGTGGNPKIGVPVTYLRSFALRALSDTNNPTFPSYQPGFETGVQR